MHDGPDYRPVERCEIARRRESSRNEDGGTGEQSRPEILAKSGIPDDSLREPRLRDPSTLGSATPSSRAAPGQQRPQVGGGEGKPLEILVKALALPLEGVQYF